jgi:hypothetical protein
VKKGRRGREEKRKDGGLEGREGSKEERKNDLRESKQEVLG